MTGAKRDRTGLQLSAAKQARARALAQPPAVAWPTVLLLAACLVGLAASDVAGVTRAIPLWAACAINTMIAYLLFSVIHDALHRAVSSHIGFNDWCGWLATTAMSPGTTLGLFRWGHIQHHRHTTGPRDPDNWLHGGRRWTLPLRWAVIDVYYLIYVIRHGDHIARRYLKSAFIGLAVLTAVAITLLAMGYWLELLMLWLLPTRLQSILLGFSFFWLPHVPHDVSARENRYRATTVRIGHEWLLTPVLQFHNYHLLHHLYPRAPFYNLIRLWRLLEPELRRQQLAIQHDFAIRPVIHRPQT